LEAARAHGPFELVFHTVGTAVHPLSTCRSLLTPTGVVALVAVRPAADGAAIAFARGVHASLGRSTGVLLGKLATSVAKGKLECIVEAKLPLAEAEEAHARSRRGKVVGKLVLSP
jgi:NADPH:quinone reductase-like Zn-dependent oxidoreductase